jgi:hypothetical protein
MPLLHYLDWVFRLVMWRRLSIQQLRSDLAPQVVRKLRNHLTFFEGTKTYKLYQLCRRLHRMNLQTISLFLSIKNAMYLFFTLIGKIYRLDPTIGILRLDEMK